MVALLTGVVVVLVVCHTPKTFINLYESYHMLRYGKMTAEPLWSKIIIKLSHLLLSLSSALNIIIYSAKVTNYLYCIISLSSLQDFKFRAVLSVCIRRLSLVSWLAKEEAPDYVQGGNCF